MGCPNGSRQCGDHHCGRLCRGLSGFESHESGAGSFGTGFGRVARVGLFADERAGGSGGWVMARVLAIAADVPARVTSVVAALGSAVQEGASIKAGDLLVELDPSDYQQQVGIAEQMLREFDQQQRLLEVEKQVLTEREQLETGETKIARDELDRAIALQDRDVTTRREVEQYRREWLRLSSAALTTQERLRKLPAQIELIKAQHGRQSSNLALARLNLDRCRVTSPIDGVLQFVDVDLGENLVPGARIARVVDPKRLEIPLRLPASARAVVRPGDAATLSDGTAHQWAKCVTRIEPEDDQQTRTFGVYLDLDQSEMAEGGRLAPGRFVSGTVVAGEAVPRWVVPQRALRDGRIWGVDAEGAVRSVVVREAFAMQFNAGHAGLADRQWMALEEVDLTGLSLVVDASRTLAEGQRVQAVRSEGP